MEMLKLESGDVYLINELLFHVVSSEVHYMLSSVNWDSNESRPKMK